MVNLKLLKEHDDSIRFKVKVFIGVAISLMIWGGVIFSDELTVDDKTIKNIIIYIVQPKNEKNEVYSFTPYAKLGVYLYKKLNKCKDINNKYIMQSGDRIEEYNENRFCNVPIKDIDITFEFVKGSLEGALKVHDEAGGISISQSDVLFDFINSNKVNNRKVESDVRSVSRLFSEYYYLVDKDAKIIDNVDLYDGDVCGGEIGTGTQVTTRNIIDILNPSWKIQYCGNDEDTLYASVKSKPESSENNKFKLFSKDEADLVSHKYKNVYKSIDYEDEEFIKSFDFIDESMGTISVEAILVANDNLPVDVLLNIVSILEYLKYDSDITSEENKVVKATSDRNAVEVYEPTGLSIKKSTNYEKYCRVMNPKSDSADKIQNSYDGLPIALHSKIRNLKLGWPSSAIATVSPLIVLAMLINLVVIKGLVHIEPYINKYCVISKSGKETIAKKSLLKPFVYILFFVFLHFFISTMIWVSEYNENTISPDSKLAFAGMWKSFVWILQYIVGIQSDAQLKSVYSLIWLGVLKSGYAISSFVVTVGIANKIIDKFKGGAMPVSTLVLGENSLDDMVFTELNKMGKNVLRFNGDIYKVFSSEYGFEPNLDVRLHGYNGEPVDIKRRDLDNKISAVIILADRGNDVSKDTSDLVAIRNAEIVVSWIRSIDKCKSIRVVLEVRSRKNIGLGYSLGVDEVICVESFGAEMLAQSTCKPKLNMLFTELLKTNDEDYEIYYDEVNISDNGVIISDYINNNEDYSQSSDLSRTVIGVFRKNQKIEINSSAPNLKLSIGDKLIVIAKKPLINS